MSEQTDVSMKAMVTKVLLEVVTGEVRVLIALFACIGLAVYLVMNPNRWAIFGATIFYVTVFLPVILFDQKRKS